MASSCWWKRLRVWRPLARGHFPQHQAERVNIRARVGFLTFQLLRRHVGRRAHLYVGGGQRFVLLRFRQSEVEDLDARLGHHDIAGFQIAVNDPFGMRCGKSQRSARRTATRG